MGICVIRFLESEEIVRWGIVENNLVMPLSTHYASHRDLMDAFSDNPTSLQFSTEVAVPLETLQLLSPVTSDVQIFCQGLNYASHQEEGGVKTGRAKTLFSPSPPPLYADPVMTSSDLPTASYSTTKSSWHWC